MKKNLLAFAVAVLLCAPFTVHAAEWQQEPDGCIPRSMVTPDGKAAGADGVYIPVHSVSNIVYTPDSIPDSTVINDYLYEGILGTCHFFEITNLSPFTVRITIQDAAKNSAGTLIGAARTTEEDIPSGCTIFAKTYFRSVSSVSSFDTAIQVKEENFYTPVLQNIAVQTSDPGNQITITAANSGEEAAEFVQATAVFFQNGKVVYHGTCYLVDEDLELKPGTSISGQIPANSADYDSVKVCLTARKGKWGK